MENITINQKQLFDVIKRTMSLSKEYTIEKLDADGNFIVFINEDFTNFFILRKSLVDYIATKSSVYANLQDAIIEINKEKIEKQDKEIQSYKNINKQSKSDL